MKLVAAGLLSLLASPSLAQSDPGLMRCIYPQNGPEQAAAEKIMAFPLPYLDKEFIYYRDDSGLPIGSYAVRRSLRIYFYDKNNALMGTAIRRSQAVTSYFDPTGNYLGQCTNRKLVTPDERPVRFDPETK